MLERAVLVQNTPASEHQSVKARRRTPHALAAAA